MTDIASGPPGAEAKAKHTDPVSSRVIKTLSSGKAESKFFSKFKVIDGSPTLPGDGT